MLRASCRCTAPTMVRDGVLVCGACGAAIEVAPAGDVVTDYGSRPPLPPIPHRSYDWTRRNARRIPGHRREGGNRGRGVTWVIPHTAYIAWIEGAMQDSQLPPEERRARSEPLPNVARLDEWISKAGYRPTRSKR